MWAYLRDVDFVDAGIDVLLDGRGVPLRVASADDLLADGIQVDRRGQLLEAVGGREVLRVAVR